MYFGNINVKDSVNCILAHTITINKKKFSKGTVITEVDKRPLTSSKLEDGWPWKICKKVLANKILQVLFWKLFMHSVNVSFAKNEFETVTGDIIRYILGSCYLSK